MGEQQYPESSTLLTRDRGTTKTRNIHRVVYSFKNCLFSQVFLKPLYMLEKCVLLVKWSCRDCLRLMGMHINICEAHYHYPTKQLQRNTINLHHTSSWQFAKLPNQV